MAPNPRTLSLGSSGLSWLALFAASGTLVCCAFPIVLVSLGLGASVAALMSTVPFLVTLGEYKAWAFGVSGALMLLAAYMVWSSSRQCPTDATLAKRCRRANTVSRRLLEVSAGVWGIGFFAAYLALPLRVWLNL